MGNWAQHATVLDQIVDAEIGDTISYSINGAAPVPMDGFIIFEDDGFGVAGIDELKQRTRLKISKALVPNPRQTDRFTCVARLGAGTWRPSNNAAATQGRYWLVDIQRVAI